MSGWIYLGLLAIVVFAALLWIARDQQKDDDEQDEHGF